MATDGQQALATFGATGKQWEPFGNQDRRKRKMARIDDLPAPIKSVVHDFGWLTVKTFMEAGVTNAKVMRSLVHTILHEHSNEYRAKYQTTR